jgi:hypothetical protein
MLRQPATPAPSSRRLRGVRLASVRPAIRTPVARRSDVPIGDSGASAHPPIRSARLPGQRTWSHGVSHPTAPARRRSSSGLRTHWCPNGSSMVACRSPYSQSWGGSTSRAPRSTAAATTLWRRRPSASRGASVSAPVSAVPAGPLPPLARPAAVQQTELRAMPSPMTGSGLQVGCQWKSRTGAKSVSRPTCSGAM